MRAAVKEKWKRRSIRDSSGPTNTSSSTQSSVVKPAEDDVAATLSNTADHLELSPTAQLWNDAYNALKSKEPKLITEYELLLAKELDPNTSTSNIANDSIRRRAQMQEIIDKGLMKTEAAANKKKAVGQVMQVLGLVKDTVGAGLEASSEASLAWAALTGILPFLINATEQSEKYREGILKVTDILVKTDTIAPYRLSDAGPFQEVLKTYLGHLYQRILSFLVKAACYCHRNRLLIIARDAIKLGDWDTQIQDIRDAEKEVLMLDSDIKAHYRRQYEQARLSDLRNEKDNACLAKLMLSDPRLDKKRIETTKGGLVHESYSWIFGNSEFKTWESDGGVLWVRSDPGKGKTMLLCGIINELNAKAAYFFCQATDNSNNTGVCVLRGLIYMIANERPSLISVIRERFDKSKNIFDKNSWYILSEILKEMLTDDTYIVIDALDECIEGRQELIRFIASNHTKARWIISSRNWLDIEHELKGLSCKVVSLETNSASVSQAVEHYITSKVDQLATSEDYSAETKELVMKSLQQGANGTFLWASLACMNLANVRYGNVASTLKKLPPGLDEIYDGMWQMMQDKEDAHLLERILAVSALVIRPVSLGELRVILEIPDEVLTSLDKVVQDCGSFLTIRQDVINFVHLSAKEYLDSKIRTASKSLHQEIYSRSMQAMFNILKRDIYMLKKPAVSMAEIQIPEPEFDPLACIRYSCTGWVHHLNEYGSISKKEADLLQEFLTYHYLPWLEATSLLKSTATAMIMMYDLEALTKQACKNDPEREDMIALRSVVYDARRYLDFWGKGIASYPLQTYYTGLVFSPKNSIVKKTFSSYAPRYIQVLYQPNIEWGTTLARFMLHPDSERAIATAIHFSNDDEWFLVAYKDGIIQMWHIRTRALIKSTRITTTTDQEPEYCIRLVLLQHLDKVICHCHSGIGIIWDLSTNQISDLDLTGIINISNRGLIAVLGTPNSLQFYDALASDHQACMHLDLDLFTTQDTLGSTGLPVPPLVFSTDSKSVAIRVAVKTVEVWSIEPRKLLCTVLTTRHKHHTMALSKEYFSLCESHHEVVDKTDQNYSESRTVISLYSTEGGNLKWTFTIDDTGDSFFNPKIEISQDNRFVVLSNCWSYILETASGTCVWRSDPLTYSWLSANLRYILCLWGGPVPSSRITLEDSFQVKLNAANHKIVEKPVKAWVEAISRDGSRIISWKDPGGRVLIEVESNTVLQDESNHRKMHQVSDSMKLIMIENVGEPTCKINQVLQSGLHEILVLDGHINGERSHNRRSCRNCSFAPDDSHIAAVMQDSRIAVWRLADQTEILSVSYTNFVTGLNWSSDSKRLSVSMAPGFILIDVERATELLRNDRASSMGFSTDGSSLMLWCPDLTSDFIGALIEQSTEIDRDSYRGQPIAEDDTNYISTTRSDETLNDEKEGEQEEVIRVGSWVEWNTINNRGRVVKHFPLLLSIQKLCFDSQFLVVAANTSELSSCSDQITIRVWDRASGAVISDIHYPTSTSIDSLRLEDDTLYSDCGVMPIKGDGVHFGSQDECFYDGIWLWKENKKIMIISNQDIIGYTRYNNRILGIGRIEGGFTVLKWL